MRLCAYADLLAGRAAAEQELRHRRREADAHGCDFAAQRLHRVVDREAGVDLAAGGVQVERDRQVGVLGFDDEELGAHPLGERTVDRAGEHDPSLLEHAAGDVVAEGDGIGIGCGVSPAAGCSCCNCMVARLARPRPPGTALGCNS